MLKWKKCVGHDRLKLLLFNTFGDFCIRMRYYINIPKQSVKEHLLRPLRNFLGAMIDEIFKQFFSAQMQCYIKNFKVITKETFVLSNENFARIVINEKSYYNNTREFECIINRINTNKTLFIVFECTVV